VVIGRNVRAELSGRVSCQRVRSNSLAHLGHWDMKDWHRDSGRQAFARRKPVQIRNMGSLLRLSEGEPGFAFSTSMHSSKGVLGM